MKVIKSIKKNSKKYYQVIESFFSKLEKDNISAFSAQSAFFIVFSFFPFVIIIMQFTNFLPYSNDDFINLVSSIMPYEVKLYTENLINEIYGKTTGAVLSLSIITVLWSASRGVISVSNCFNHIYKVKETRNFILFRIISTLYTLIMVMLLMLTLIILVFGNQLYIAVVNNIPMLNNIANHIINFRNLLGIILFFIFFILIYKTLPSCKLKFKDILPGSLFATSGWMILSTLLSIYVDYFSNFYYIYGSISNIIIALLWLYICMFILFIGAEINWFWNKHSDNLK